MARDALRLSTGLRNGLATWQGWRELLDGCRLYVYSGDRPASADSAPTGTLLVTFTLGSGAYTEPVRSQAIISLSGAGGSLDTVKVGGAAYNLLSATVPYSTTGSNVYTAIDVAANINARQNPWNIVAVAEGLTVRLNTPFWLGAGANGLALATTVTAPMTASVNYGESAAFGGAGSGGPGITVAGVSSVNGIPFTKYADSPGTVRSNNGSTLISGTAAATGTAGYMRIVGAGSSHLGLSTAAIRMDGTIGTSDTVTFTLGDVSITSGVAQTINSLVLSAIFADYNLGY